jgi:hypothetical protein
MILETLTLAPQSAKAKLFYAIQNPAVAHCQRLWKRFYCASLKKHGSPAVAQLDAADAFREALPILDGLDNIRDFIACVGYAMAADVFIEETGIMLLYAARLALTAAGPRKKAAKNRHKPLIQNNLQAKSLPPSISPKTLDLAEFCEKTKDLQEQDK